MPGAATTNSCFLVTGAGGFIGTWVIRELLRRQLGVVALDATPPNPHWDCLTRPQRAASHFRYVEADILDRAQVEEILDRHAVTHVIHLVGLLTPACQQDPVRGCEVNVLGTVRLFEMLRARRERIHGISYASSYAVHGPAGGTSQSPGTFYGVFKRTVELIAEQYHRHFGLNSVGLRPFVVYGAGREQGISAAPSLAAKAAAAGKPYQFSFSGAAGLVYVEDVARGFVRAALEAPSGCHVIDMPGQETTMEEVIKILDRLRPGARTRLSVAGPPLPAAREDRPTLMPSLFPDWQDTPLEQGLGVTVEHWQFLNEGTTKPDHR